MWKTFCVLLCTTACLASPAFIAVTQPFVRSAARSIHSPVHLRRINLGPARIPGVCGIRSAECDDGSADNLNNEKLLDIVLSKTPDAEVNELVWRCLGYVQTADGWDSTNVFPKWKLKFPEPPDFLNVQRIWTKEVDEPCLRATQALQKSVPTESKNGLKTALLPLGWKGFKMDGLTPNMTRRAQCANWLVYFRDHLQGVSLEELMRRKAEREAVEAQAETLPPTGTTKTSVV